MVLSGLVYSGVTGGWTGLGDGLLGMAVGLACLLPLYRARRRWSDRTKELELPLFAGYVFGRFSASDRTRVLSTPA